jgi:uncharacterized protein (TIGR02466 family)
MEKQTWKLFPTVVHSFRRTLAPDQLETIRQHCLAAETGPHGAFFGDARSSFGRESRLLEDMESRHANLRGLCAGLGSLLTNYARELGFERVKMSNSWFNIQRPGSILKHHVHPDSKVSAALCIQADEKSSKLCLDNPSPFLNLLRPDTHTEATFEFAKFALAPGDMVLFPSWIKHGSGSEPNLSEQRLVISMNGS